MKQNLSREEIIRAICRAGVVGGGGAGFPGHIKYDTSAEIVIINGAECEPLLRVDQQLMSIKAEEILEGLKIVMSVTGATKGIIALKSKYRDAIEAFHGLLHREPDISMYIMGNYYPAGDEQMLVYEVTGRIVPEKGIPPNVGVVVTNVVSIYNVFNACNGNPVISRPITITGAVKEPVTLELPLGITVREAISFAGGPKVHDYSVIRGGPMMGSVNCDLESPVIKTDSSIILLPSNHHLIKTRTSSIERSLKLAKNCCHCTYCTMLCPRYLIGHNLKPHMIMRIVAYGLENASVDDLCQAYLCCQCGICSLVACPLDLQPREIYGGILRELISKGIPNPHKRKPLSARPLMKMRRISASGLITRLELSEYDVKAPWKDMEINPAEVIIPLSQHTGSPAIPEVKAGDMVSKGQIIGTVPRGRTGAWIHSSISGRVSKVSEKSVIIKAY